MIVVCDATPLILLAKLSDFKLLKTLYQQIYIPRQVYDDVVTKGKGKPGEEELEEGKGDWIKVRTVSSHNKVKELQDIYGLGKGEAAAIIFAKELKLIKKSLSANT